LDCFAGILENNMAHFLQSPEEPFIAFDRGIDREDTRTNIEKGGYDAAQNVLLRCAPMGGTHVCAMANDPSLDPLITWKPGDAIFVAPFTYSTYSSNVLSFNTHLLITRDSGAVWRYDTGTPGTETIVRRGFTTSQKYWTHAVYDQWLLTFNGREAPMKYGQHFLDQGEARPFMFPIGSKPVSPIGATITDENWTHAGASAFVADASVPGGGSRVHTQSLNVAVSSNSYNSWTAAKNFLTGPFPYGGTDFTSTDYLVFQVFKAAGTANVRIRFGNDANTVYFEWTQSVGPSTGWQTFRLLRSAAVVTGAAVWTSIKRLTLFNDDAANTVYFDDVYFLYANAPPALQVATSHKGRVVGGGAPTAGTNRPTLANLYWSRALFPDEFPVSNSTIVSGGTSALAQANMVTAVREFGTSIIVGTPSSVNAFTVDSAGLPTLQLVTNETGIDSHKSMVESPNGAMMYFWQRGIYVLRSTWRSNGSPKIAHIFDTLNLSEPWWTTGVFDEKTQTIRFWFRDNSVIALTTKGIVLDYVRAQELGEGVWPSTMTQMADMAIPAIVNGNREVIYVRFDEQGVYRLGTQESGALTCNVELPWMSREGKDRLIVPYGADQPVKVYARYASHPESFNDAVYSLIQTLPASPAMAEQARVLFGSTSRWIQIKFETATAKGMEIFSPIMVTAIPTKRMP
jgi:hypothetical protein